MEHLKGLNEAQKKAVLTTEGPVLVLAGAGAGKTKTIAHRIAHIVNSGTPASAILAITFTNKASREMRDRVTHMLASLQLSATGYPTVSTFHALSAQLLRKYATVAGISPHFTIFDRADSLRSMKRAIYAVVGDDARYDPRSILSIISKTKGNAVALEQYHERGSSGWDNGKIAQIWSQYDGLVHKDGALDFDDLLLFLWRILETNHEVRRGLQQQYQYIHVDEYQDTNKVQYEIIRHLGGEKGNIFCVGDLDQAVYGWRGATISNILEFEKGFPDAQILKLEQNYRSTKTIVGASNDIIKKNRNRREKTLFTENQHGEGIRVIAGYDERDEADKIVTEVCELLNKGVPACEIAILFRANYQSRVIEEAFLAVGVRYRVLGVRFFDRKEVKDTLSYVRAALNPNSWADIGRVINTPLRGIGKVTIDKLVSQGVAALTGKARIAVDHFFGVLSNIRTFSESHTASETLAHTLITSGIMESLSGKNEEDVERLENVRELVSLATTRYDALGAPEGLLRLFEDAALATDQDEMDNRTDRADRDAVTLMTVHAAKGLEFANVFVTGMEEGLFPYVRPNEREAFDNEEERRLFYVALTRAKTKVYLTYAQIRTIFGQYTPRIPSSFLLDIDEQYLDTKESEGQKGRVVYLD